jgi:hypothetical protein
MKMIQFKPFFTLALGNIVAGMLFGTGCIIVEHAHNRLWRSESTIQEQEDIAPVKQKSPQVKTARSAPADTVASQ